MHLADIFFDFGFVSIQKIRYVSLVLNCVKFNKATKLNVQDLISDMMRVGFFHQM